MRGAVRTLIGLAMAMCVASAIVVPLAHADPPPENADWSEHYFPMGDGINTLHADVFRPKDQEDKKTPVILTVTPYANHAGSTSEYNAGSTGPNPRFYDFLELTDILDKGYSYVMVDLPGFGGSSGCNDWGGAREQMAVKAAVEWAASQEWSTGKVGLMGKSYDGWTGLMGMAQKPKGLAAVVSMEPVYSGYRYFYNNGVRFEETAATTAGFQAYDAKPGVPQDDPMYQGNGAPQAWCYGVNVAIQQIDDESHEFWKERNLLLHAKKSKVPIFLTQGFIETNTKADAAFDFWNGLEGKNNHAWFGQFNHWRGWEKNGAGQYYTGRKVFINEVMRFLDQHVKGKDTATEKDPTVAVQDILGRYRAEAAWPPADSKVHWTKLNLGTYVDDRNNTTLGGQGLWTVSQRLPHDVWLSGEPIVEVTADAVTRSNVVVNVYDIAPDGRALPISRGTMLFRDPPGSQTVKFDMYGQDAPIAKGHRIGVLLSGSNTDWWGLDVPTNQEITVTEARIGLPFLTFARTKFLDGKATPDLGTYRATLAAVGAETVKSAAAKFTLPGKLRRR